MKISVDGGGLGAKIGERFGNFIFSENLITALLKYDKNNQYFIYSLEKLKPHFGWSKIRLSLEELKEKKDIFLALNQAIPFYVSGKIISFCHGLSYYFYPDLYSKKDVYRLTNQLNEMIRRSDFIVVSSIKIKKELILINHNIKEKIIVIPFGVPFDMLENNQKHNSQKKYFLFVGMNHQIKNISFIKDTFNEFNKLSKNKSFQLKIINKNCSRKKLKKLYQEARALLTASHYESFNLPVLEALFQGCPVIGLKSAIIPELKKYVNVAKNKKQFIKLMTTIPIKPTVQLINQLKQEFSWEKYVEKLIKLY